MIDLPGMLTFSMSDLAAGVLSAHAWTSEGWVKITGQPLPLPAFASMPFLLPALWALVLRQVLVLLCVLALAWLGSAALVGAGLAPVGFLQFATAFVTAVSLCVKTSLDARQKHRLRAERDEVQSELALTSNSLDRERFWRRANGDVRSMIADSEIASLIDRIQNFGRKRPETPA